jgi:hypothetical protein
VRRLYIHHAKKFAKETTETGRFINEASFMLSACFIVFSIVKCHSEENTDPKKRHKFPFKITEIKKQAANTPPL